MIIDKLNITEKTKKNLLRKEHKINTITLNPKGPLPTWIDLNPTELCNRKCVFCPRVDDALYPNLNLNMPRNLAKKLNKQLRDIGFLGTINISGYGEPLLHPQITDIVNDLKLSCSYHVEIVTNGDKLSVELIKALFEKGLDYLCISLYDGPHQIVYFEDLLSKANINKQKYLLRDRWHSKDMDYGVKLTNRAGVLKHNNEENNLQNNPCLYTAYSFSIDWNGDWLLCPQDWEKKVKFGNINYNTVEEIWFSPQLAKKRHQLMNGNRRAAPCSSCDANGCLYGEKHKIKWLEKN